MVNSKALKSKMTLLEIKQEYLADKLKISQSALSQKLNNERSVTIDEMFRMSEILKIKPSDFKFYFFVWNLRNARYKKVGTNNERLHFND